MNKLIKHQLELQILAALDVCDLTFAQVKELMSFNNSQTQYNLGKLYKEGYIMFCYVNSKTGEREPRSTSANLTLYTITTEGKKALKESIEFLESLVPNAQNQVKEMIQMKED